MPQLKIDGTAYEPWNKLEEYATQLVNDGNELYIIDGGYGTKIDPPRTNILQAAGINVPDRLWKVIVVMNPGDNISDVNPSTSIIAVDMPNDAGVDGQTWQNYSLKIKTLEEILKNSTGLNYNFFSNVRKDIREILEEKGTITPLLASVNGLEDESIFASFGTFNSPAILPYSAPIKGIVAVPPTLGISQVSHNQNSGFQITTTQNTSGEFGCSKVNSLHIGTSEISFSPIRPIDSGITQVSLGEISFNQVGMGQTSSEQSSPRQIGETTIKHFQVSPAKINPSQVSLAQGRTNLFGITSTQIDPSKITFASSIPLQQFFSSNLPNHDSTSNYLTQLQSTLATYWNIPTDLNLTFNIANLPTGQLAEATISAIRSIET